MDAGGAENNQSVRGLRRPRLKVAWFSPVPPARTGVAEYCKDLLPYLKPYMDVDLFADEPRRSAGTALAKDFSIYDFRDFPSRRHASNYDLNLYQMGNDIAHRFVYLTLMEYPGLVVLHEPVLHHFMLQMLSAGWTSRDYSYELDYNYGVARPDIEKRVASDVTERSRFDYPMLQRVVDSSLGIIVHSQCARREVLRHNPPGPVKVVRHPYVPVAEIEELSSGEARRMIGLDNNDFLVGTFGFITPAKQVDTILDALERVLPDAPAMRLLLVGGTAEEYPIESIVRDRGLDRNVIVTGYVDWLRMLRYMVASDLAVALRWPSAGETPGTVIRLLGLGRPTIISRTMAYAEFPDEVCIKVDAPCDPAQLADRLLFFYRERSELRKVGDAARAYIAGGYSVTDVARDYRDFAEALLLGITGRAAPGQPTGDQEQLRAYFLGEIAGLLDELGVPSASFRLAEDVFRCVEGLFPPE